MELSVIIPCYNEEKNIQETIIQTNSLLKKNKTIKKFEIICIDDGSTDDTRDVILKQKIPNVILNKKRKNFGKGYSVKQGMMMAKYNTAIFFDADRATPINEVNKFISYPEEFDILIGSRMSKESKAKRTLLRGLAGKTFLTINNLILGTNFKDTQCGFKMFNLSKTKKIFELQKTNGFAFDAEILYLAKKFKYKIKEIPISWKEADNSSINLAKESIKMFMQLLKIRFRKYETK
jgi:dolichyl-phosphate beta-glucosyltransferase